MNRAVSTSHSQPTKLRLPKRILLVRHGQSLGNVNEEAYHTIPDWLIPITEVGHNQAKDMGKKIKELIGNEPIYLYYSPYLRTRQTMVSMMESLQDNPIYGIREEPRITEQQFGNFQNTEMENYKKEKNSFGRFYYRFPDGESGLDVYNRVTSFIGSLFREWYSHTSDEEFKNTNVIIVTHGLSLRLFIMRWFHFTVHQFEQSINPHNGAIVIMERVTRKVDKPSNSLITNHQNALVPYNLPEDMINKCFTKTSQQLVHEEDDYILDLHPVSSYEKVEMSRCHRNISSHNNNHSGSGNSGFYNSFYGHAGINISQHGSKTISSNTHHHPHRHSSKENLSTIADYDHHLEEESTLEPQPVDEYECFVLTKESQELLQFYIPKKSKKVENSKYFRWKEYNQIYKLEEEINADVESLAICPRMKLAVKAVQKNDERQRRLHHTNDQDELPITASDHCSEDCHKKRKGEDDREL